MSEVKIAMDYGMAQWLYRLAQAKVHKNEKALEKFAPKFGQTDEEAAAVLAEFQRNIEWQKTVLARLKEIERAVRP